MKRQRVIWLKLTINIAKVGYTVLFVLHWTKTAEILFIGIFF